MTLEDVLGAAHQWLETVKTKYGEMFRIEILSDTDLLFRVIMETENPMSELAINEPGFAPYRFVSFQTLDVKDTQEQNPMLCFYDDEFCGINEIVERLNQCIKNIVVCEHFLRAAEEFDFEIIMPYCLDKDKRLFAFGYMPKYGSQNGAVICLMGDEPEKKLQIKQWCAEHNCFWSFLNTEVLSEEYKRSYFRELLRDWKV